MPAASLASLLRKLRPAARPPRRARGFRLLLEQLEDRLTPSTLIPVTNHRDLVFDAGRAQLDITTSGGQVQRWAAGGPLLSPINVGNSLYGADITPDGTSLYATEGQTNNGQGTVHKVNLNTGAVTNLTYALSSLESGSYSIAVGGNGKALFDGSFAGSGWVPLRQIDLSTDALSTRTDDPGSGGGGQVRQNTVIRRGPDPGRSLFLLTEANISNGPAFTYNAPANSFAQTASYTNMFLDNRLTAVNRNGTLIAVEMYNGAVSVLDANLHVVKNLPAIDGGVVFDPNQDVLYGASSSGGVLFVYDTNTWAVKFPPIPIGLLPGEAIGPASQYGNGVMAVSSNSQYVYLATTQGVREILLPPPTGTPYGLLPVQGFPTYVEQGVPGTITIAVKDPAGNITPGYRGTVHFTSSDAAASLPADYTFTTGAGGDNGVHTFTVTLKTAGSQSITAQGTGLGPPAVQGNITVHAALAAPVVPVTDHEDLVYDPTRNYLYITTGHGTVERYDVAHQTLLAPVQAGASLLAGTQAPFQAGAPLLGADITPDGKSLYVADGQRGATQGSFHAVNLSTGAVTDLNYNLTSASWTVRLDAHGTGVADEQFEGSGWVPLYEVDTTANTLTPITNDPGSGGGGQVRQNTMIYRSADRSYVFFTESNISSGPIFAFDFTAGWSKAVNTNAFLDNAPAGVNRNGTLIALQIGGNTLILDKTLNVNSPVKTLTGVTGALEFDPASDLLYVANGSTITAYNTNSWAVQFTLPVGESVGTYSAFGNGTMAVSADDRYLFVATASGVRVLPLPVSNQLVVSGFPNPTTAGASGSVTVTAEDSAGHVLTGYTGTVHFSSSDGQAVLPADYTFVAGDNGSHTFTNGVTLKTAGTQSISATDTANPALTGGETNITVSPAAAASLTLSGLPASVRAGTAVSVTVTAKDAYGNVATGYRATVHFTSTDPLATAGSGLPADYTFAAGDNGAHVFTNGVTLKTAGSQSVTVSDGTLQNSQSTTVTATQLVITVQPPGMVAPGAAFGLTVTAEDANGNVATTFGDPVTLALASNPGGATLGGTTTLNASSGVAAFTGLTLDKTGIGYTIQATSGSLTKGTTNSFDVDSLTLSNSSVFDFRPVGSQVGTLSTTPGTGHTFTYTLVSGTGSTDNGSFSVSGSQLLTADAFDGTKSSYSVRVRTTDERGLSLEQPFTVTAQADPALSLSGGALTVKGTSGNDVFAFTPGATRDAMTRNGVSLAVDTAAVPGGVVFNGGGGSDSATLSAVAGAANTLVLGPAGGSLSGPGYKVTVSGVAQVVAVGHAGDDDRAYLAGSACNDVFVGTPTYAYLSGPGYFEQADSFFVALATGAGGSDTAYLSGGGNDAFVGTPAYAYLYGSGFFNQANGFAVAVGTNTTAGTGQAYLYGDAHAANVFVGTAGYSYLYGGSAFFNQANGFQTVVGWAASAADAAYLYGAAAGPNVFVGSPTYSQLSGPADPATRLPTFVAYASGFHTVVAAAGTASDTAYLYDTPGGTFAATSTYALVSAAAGQPAQLEQANGFRSVYGYSGGGDSAFLYGTMTAADTFVQAGGIAYLLGPGFFELESGFASVWANPFAHR
jgi:hypothetical protein